MTTDILTQSGIYKITNTKNGKFYIGSAIQFKSRFVKHKSKLKKGIHHSQKLQSSWNKNGSDCFIFEPIEIVLDKEKLIEREQFYIDSLCAFGENGYNMRPIANSLYGFKHSEESKIKMSQTKKGKKKPERTKEHCENLSKSLTGKKRTPEMIAKMSERAKGKAVSEETRKKLSELHKGRKQSPEHIKKVQESRKKNEKQRKKLQGAIWNQLTLF
jgi:group I intron endonuclease